MICIYSQFTRQNRIHQQTSVLRHRAFVIQCENGHILKRFGLNSHEKKKDLRTRDRFTERAYGNLNGERRSKRERERAGERQNKVKVRERSVPITSNLQFRSCACVSRIVVCKCLPRIKFVIDDAHTAFIEFTDTSRHAHVAHSHTHTIQ